MARLLVFILASLLGIETVNAGSPIFDTPPTNGGSGSIPANTTVGSTIITLQATDNDGDWLAFAVAAQTPPTPAFTVNMIDDLIVPSGLDYKTTIIFALTLSVTDGTNTVTTTYNLTVKDVDDEDDESPVFSPNTYTATILDAGPAGTSVVTVTATDADSSSFTYSIQGAQTTFAISATGTITVSDPRGLSSLGASVTMIIDANDGTNPAGRATVTITIQAYPCNSSPCLNEGTCVSMCTTTYTSTCLSGYTGIVCENASPCYSYPCQNGGTCIITGMTTHSCACLSGYTGTNCENVSVNCPYGWLAHGRKCYHFSHDVEQWRMARLICQDFGGDLAEVHTIDDDLFLVMEVNSRQGHFWLGGNDLEIEGVWMWVHSRSPITGYVNWRAGEPNNAASSENCMALDANKPGWNDDSCMVGKFYICEKDLTALGPAVIG